MSKNHYVGGKTKPASTNPPQQRKPRSADILLPCECGRSIKTVLTPGDNDIFASCECGAMLHVRAVYDGRGLANIYAGTIEKVVA